MSLTKEYYKTIAMVLSVLYAVNIFKIFIKGNTNSPYITKNGGKRKREK